MIFKLRTEAKPKSSFHHTYNIFHNDLHIGHFCILYTINDASLWKLEIYEQFRNKGYSKIVMTKIISIVKENGYNSLQLFVSKNNIIAKKLYKNLGFKFINHKMFSKDLEFVMMYLKF